MVCFKVTALQVRLNDKLGPGYYSREGGVWHKGKILTKINPWRVVDFSSEIFLVQSSVRKSLIYCERNFYNLGKN